MSDRIAMALERIFEKHQIVFWYDAKRELRQDFEGLSLAGVRKLEIANNEFGLKYHILQQLEAERTGKNVAQQRFLLYREGPQPADLDNWLLDLQLASGEFRTDQVALWLSELDLGVEFTDVAQEHKEFFRARKRREDLHRRTTNEDSANRLRLHMLAVCAGSESRLESVMAALLQELAEGRDERMRLIERCQLSDYLWEQLGGIYGYQSPEPGLRDFLIELFKSCYLLKIQGESRLTADALVFLANWKDNRRHAEDFRRLSAECADALNIEQDLHKRDMRELEDVDYFELIERKIISDLVGALVARTCATAELESLARSRKTSFWYEDYRHLYEAVECAARLLSELEVANLEMRDIADAVQRYARSWFRVDQLYRQFVYHARKANQASLMTELTAEIEGRYANSFLLALGDGFQQVLDAATSWDATPVARQDAFFRRWVQPFLQRGHRICVIVSDAMRYEIGEELLGRIRRENRYEAELEPAVSMLPSYTQLGMAALLPNEKLELQPNAVALVDGQSSQGTANRGKILATVPKCQSVVCKAGEVRHMKGDECRALVRENDLIYIYHNQIDATGDKRDSEEQVFDAVESTLDELVQLVKKLSNANVNNLLITADHGFLYQQQQIDESDFLASEPCGAEVLYRDRRFVLGRGLRPVAGLNDFSAAFLGLHGDVQIQIPRSVNRLRLQGSGSRFVHGGASLQEVVIPVLRVNKSRQGEIRAVDVAILRGASSLITSGQLAVNFYQTEPVADKVQARTLEAGIYTQDGELISDSHRLEFDSESENPRDREVLVRFVLSRLADDMNGRQVELRLREKLGDTTHFRDYKSERYEIRRSFTTDFDF